MRLSIIIVNYNVKYFVKQLIDSIFASDLNDPYEIIVVDNASIDGSVPFLRREFSSINIIANSTNEGFSSANNTGIKKSIGEFVLLLNPDTILQEDTLRKSVAYMETHPNTGALGCRMIDGAGDFLPESKRGFPTPRVALFKALGLHHLFPRSKFFNEYYLGYLAEGEINRVDVLTGAFMLLRRKVLEKTGLLDTDFFMYGEDIDLSYRIKKLGYDIVYFPLTTIIHYKGESTRKQSFQYIKRFYGAMQIFAGKHYQGRQGLLLRLVLQLGIILKGSLEIAKNFLTRFGAIILDWISIAIALKVFSLIWAKIYFENANYYEHSSIHYNIFIYASVWVLVLLLVGAYDQLSNFRRALRGVIVGWLVIAVLYGFLGVSLRPSRFMVFTGVLIVAPVIMLLRFAYHWFKFKEFPWSNFQQKRYVVVGTHQQMLEIKKFLSTQQHMTLVGFISDAQSKGDNQFLGSLDQLDEIVRFHSIQEIIFCSTSIPSGAIMKWMTKLGPKLSFKIATERPQVIIGSDSRNTTGEIYTIDIKYLLDEPFVKRNKRFFDIICAGIALILSPVLIFFVKDRWSHLQNLVSILSGKMTFVSYGNEAANDLFPALRPGILVPNTRLLREDESQAQLDADYFYARDYSVLKDLSLVLNNIIRNLASGRA